MDELLKELHAAGVRYLVVGGQAMRLTGMPRYSMDWDFFIPAKDHQNFAKLNVLLDEDVDAPLVPLGPRGENFIQTYQTRWGVLLQKSGVNRFHKSLDGRIGDIRSDVSHVDVTDQRARRRL